jgi:hypothetical protein
MRMFRFVPAVHISNYHFEPLRPCTDDEHVAFTKMAMEAEPLEWITPKGILVPLRPWWCFWRPRKILIRMSPFNIECYRQASKRLNRRERRSAVKAARRIPPG